MQPHLYFGKLLSVARHHCDRGTPTPAPAPILITISKNELRTTSRGRPRVRDITLEISVMFVSHTISPKPIKLSIETE